MVSMSESTAITRLTLLADPVRPASEQTPVIRRYRLVRLPRPQ